MHTHRAVIENAMGTSMEIIAAGRYGHCIDAAGRWASLNDLPKDHTLMVVHVVASVSEGAVKSQFPEKNAGEIADAVFRLNVERSRFGAAIRAGQMASLSDQQIAEHVGLTADQVRAVIIAWGMDT